MNWQSSVLERDDGKLCVSSLAVARNLEKEHKEVLEKIRELDCTGAFTDRNFTASEYRVLFASSVPVYFDPARQEKVDCRSSLPHQHAVVITAIPGMYAR
jgi:hypothetical protein